MIRSVSRICVSKLSEKFYIVGSQISYSYAAMNMMMTSILKSQCVMIFLYILKEILNLIAYMSLIALWNKKKKKLMRLVLVEKCEFYHLEVMNSTQIQFFFKWLISIISNLQERLENHGTFLQKKDQLLKSIMRIISQVALTLPAI